MIDWKFKNIEDTARGEPRGSSDGFWYDLTLGGYLRPEDVLEDKNQINEVKKALAILLDFQESLEDSGMTNYDEF